MQKNYSGRKVIYMEDVQGPEKVNDTWVKTMYMGTMDRGFTVCLPLITLSTTVIFKKLPLYICDIRVILQLTVV
jgi:hypothetical protein